MPPVIHGLMVHMHICARLWLRHSGVFGMRGGKHAHDLHHTSMHMIEQVAVKCPVPDMFGGNIYTDLVCGFDCYGVLARLVMAAAIDEIEEHSVQMNGMRHHRVIDQGEP